MTHEEQGAIAEMTDEQFEAHVLSDAREAATV